MNIPVIYKAERYMYSEWLTWGENRVTALDFFQYAIKIVNNLDFTCFFICLNSAQNIKQ